jgi:hypothetical protein
MIDLDDDDDDGLLFDEPDEDAASAERTNVLVVGWVPPAEMLCTMEQQYRHCGVPPVIFEEIDGEGNLVFGNASEYCALMGLAPDTPITIEQAMAWAEQQRLLTSWQW